MAALYYTVAPSQIPDKNRRANLQPPASFIPASHHNPNPLPSPISHAKMYPGPCAALAWILTFFLHLSVISLISFLPPPPPPFMLQGYIGMTNATVTVGLSHLVPGGSSSNDHGPLLLRGMRLKINETN